ncbi:Glycosyltransferase involved in cell wall bisynthesis [Sphingomonas gellani]|uniref:Glycosyltransferase involved in cell wall bisynthesis n=1 Tax=Sphingomonas gellani TaxID=1166340 RepID=A0A1H8I7C0_9SPHN|nr:glycosyltransferase family 1 protein [Sphingomonas gellani]SEN64254.1 Glycosyltransferase involved in cell wall bisynthesis [Sphingomonas gellani]
MQASAAQIMFGNLRAPGPDVEVVLDLSRLVSRIRHPTPTGVDRVELAYARELHHQIPDQLSFSAVLPTGHYGRIPAPRTRRFLDGVERLWTAGAERLPHGVQDWPRLLRTLALVRPAPVPPPQGPRVFLQSSPHHLHRPALMRAILEREQAAFACLLHDLIPIEYPEYARPGGDALHLRRVRTIAALADVVIANSHATAHSFRPYLEEVGRADTRVAVAHLGLEPARAIPMPAPANEPYFICIGTIEPRKNHLLLLNLWRQMATERAFGSQGPPPPRLVLVGRRGWENEQIVDMLDRCPALVGLVEEHRALPDDRMRALLAGARALLLPSFAEGFGMPVPEALALGVPVLCSNLPALREAGGEAPEYLDPLDGPGWRRAIRALADPNGSARAAHLARIAQWRAPSWSDHLSIVLDAIARAVTR